jgi:hypothetical protein
LSITIPNYVTGFDIWIFSFLYSLENGNTWRIYWFLSLVIHSFHSITMIYVSFNFYYFPIVISFRLFLK